MTIEDKKLSSIFEMVKILITEPDLDNMLPKLLSRLIEVFDTADAGILLLHDPPTGMLRVRAGQGFNQALERLRLAPGESMTGKAFQRGRAELYATPEDVAEAMSDMTPVNREVFREATVGLKQAQSAACVPLISGQTKVGVLVLENLRLPGSFNQDDLTFLQHVADLVALSVENARLSEELQATRALAEANLLKSELISILAHEMRTPLTSIKGFSTTLLMEEADFNSETKREFLQIIDEECDVLQDLIHDLLESSAIDAGRLHLEPQPVILPRLIKSVIEDIVHSHNHRFLVDFPAEFPIVDADPLRISQVLRNLLDNAVKYSSQGGLIVVRGEVRQKDVLVSVADQGVGIAPEDLNHLFEKFFRVKPGLGRRIVGSGLGLPISRSIVESHGGRIWAESRVGQGTTLYFTLPLSAPNQGQEELSQ